MGGLGGGVEMTATAVFLVRGREVTIRRRMAMTFGRRGLLR